jgi:hypothetical protein
LTTLDSVIDPDESGLLYRFIGALFQSAASDLQERLLAALLFMPAIAGSAEPMPRHNALTLSDVHAPTLAIVCELCARRGRYSVARLMAEYGDDARLTDLLATLASCPKALSASVYDRCRAVYEGLEVS